MSGSAHLRVPMRMFGTSWRCLPGKSVFWNLGMYQISCAQFSCWDGWSEAVLWLHHRGWLRPAWKRGKCVQIFLRQYNDKLSGLVQSDWGPWGSASEALCVQHWNRPLQVSYWNHSLMSLIWFQSLLGRWASLQMVHGVGKEVLDVELAMVKCPL